MLKRLAVVTAGLCLGLVGLAPAAQATYPGSDGNIVYVYKNQIYTITPSGTDKQQLTSNGKNFRPQWSPDGTRIAYVHETSTGSRDVWVMAADGSNKLQVTHVGNVGLNVAWRPDGEVLAFAAGKDPQWQHLERVSAVAPYGEPRRYHAYYHNCTDCDPNDPTRYPLYVDRYFAWSPVGHQIAVYNHYEGAYDDAIYIYNTRTHETNEIAATGADRSGYSDWSDLFFGPAGQFGYTHADMDWATGEQLPSQILYEAWPEDNPFFRSYDYDRGGAPSPSGQYISLTNTSTGSPRILVAAADGSGRRYLTDGYQPNWQPLP